MKKLIPAFILLLCISGNAFAETPPRYNPCMNSAGAAEVLKDNMDNDEQYNTHLAALGLLLYCDREKEADREIEILSQRDGVLGEKTISGCNKTQQELKSIVVLFIHVADSYRRGYTQATQLQYQVMAESKKLNKKEFCDAIMDHLQDSLKDPEE